MGHFLFKRFVVYLSLHHGLTNKFWLENIINAGLPRVTAQVKQLYKETSFTWLQSLSWCFQNIGVGDNIVVTRIAPFQVSTLIEKCDTVSNWLLAVSLQRGQLERDPGGGLAAWLGAESQRGDLHSRFHTSNLSSEAVQYFFSLSSSGSLLAEPGHEGDLFQLAQLPLPGFLLITIHHYSITPIVGKIPIKIPNFPNFPVNFPNFPFLLSFLFGFTPNFPNGLNFPNLASTFLI